MPKGAKKIKSVVNKPANNRSDSEGNKAGTPKTPKTPKRSCRSGRSSAEPTPKKTRSTVRRRLDDALQLDRDLNGDSSGQALNLMYAILPKNSNVIRNVESRAKKQYRSKSADSSLRKGNDESIKGNLTINNQNKVQQNSKQSDELLELRVHTLNNLTNNSTAKGEKFDATTNQIIDKLGEEGQDKTRQCDHDSSTDSNEVEFQMAVDPGDDDLDAESSNEESDNEEDTPEEDLSQFEEDTVRVSSPVVNVPQLDFSEFQERPEVKEFMIKMYQATVGKKPSLVQEQARTINNIKLQINAKKEGSGNKQKNMGKASGKKLKRSNSDSTLYRPALKLSRLEKTIQSPDYVNKLKNKEQDDSVHEMINRVRLTDFPQDGEQQSQRIETEIKFSFY